MFLTRKPDHLRGAQHDAFVARFLSVPVLDALHLAVGA